MRYAQIMKLFTFAENKSLMKDLLLSLMPFSNNRAVKRKRLVFQIDMLHYLMRYRKQFVVFLTIFFLRINEKF